MTILGYIVFSTFGIAATLIVIGLLENIRKELARIATVLEDARKGKP